MHFREQITTKRGTNELGKVRIHTFPNSLQLHQRAHTRERRARFYLRFAITPIGRKLTPCPQISRIFSR